MIRYIATGAALCLLVYYINYINPTLTQSLFHQQLGVPKSWGKIEMIEEKFTLRDAFMSSDWMLQMAEHLFGFAVGIMVCLGIGWKASNFYNQIGNAYEKKLEEVVHKQTKFENKLEELDHQINTFEMTYIQSTLQLLYDRENEKKLYLGTKDTSQQMDVSKNSDKSSQTSQSRSTLTEVCKERLGQNTEEHEESLKQNIAEYEERFKQNKDETIEERFKQNKEETNCEPRPLQLSASKEAFTFVKSDIVMESEVLVPATDLNISNVPSKVEMNPEETALNSESSHIVLCPTEVEENDTADTEVHRAEDILCEDVDSLNPDDEENYPSESAYSYTKVIDDVPNEIQRVIGAGECEETFRGKIVPVSQIPHYQGLSRKSQDKTKSSKENDSYDSEVPFITNNIRISEKLGPERTRTPHTTPRKHIVCAEGNSTPRKQNMTPVEGVEGSQKNRRRKQRC